jgi:hypothetical protein
VGFFFGVWFGFFGGEELVEVRVERREGKLVRPIDFRGNRKKEKKRNQETNTHQPGVGALFLGGACLEDAGGAAAHRLRSLKGIGGEERGA